MKLPDDVVLQGIMTESTDQAIRLQVDEDGYVLLDKAAVLGVERRTRTRPERERCLRVRDECRRVCGRALPLAKKS